MLFRSPSSRAPCPALDNSLPRRHFPLRLGQGQDPTQKSSGYAALPVGTTRTARMAVPRAPPPLLSPSASSTPLRLAAQAAFAPSSKTPPYVLHVIPTASRGYLFAGSDDSIRAFSPSLEPLGTLKSSQKGITSLVAGAGECTTAAFTTARDGTVVGWDMRDLSREAFKLKGALFLRLW